MKTDLTWAMYPFVMTHQLLCKKQDPTSNTGAKELGFGRLGGATLVVIEEIIETAEGKKEKKKEEEKKEEDKKEDEKKEDEKEEKEEDKKEEEKKEEKVLKKMTTSKR